MSSGFVFAKVLSMLIWKSKIRLYSERFKELSLDLIKQIIKELLLYEKKIYMKDPRVCVILLGNRVHSEGFVF